MTKSLAPHRSSALAVVAALLATAVPRPADAATLTVGPGQQYATVASAVAAAVDGDVVQVQAGTYTNDFPVVNRRITILGVGGMARLVATVAIPNGKGILIANNSLTVERLEFAGARVADRNGAGIRYQAGYLTVRKCHFRDNENGILANPAPSGRINIRSSEFAGNGYGDGYTHGVYVNRIEHLHVGGSYFHDTRVGHHIKSRADRTTVTWNRLVDGTGGTASYSVDLPNGGVGVIANNKIVQSATGRNYALVHFGGEGEAYAGSSLRVENNLMQNFRFSAVGVLNQTSTVVGISGNRLYQLPVLASGPSSQSDNTVLTAPVAVGTGSPWAK